MLIYVLAVVQAERRRLMYSHFDEVPAAFQFVEHLDVTQEESECIAVEEDDEGEDETAAKPAKGKRAGKKAEADIEVEDGESSASEQEEEVKEMEVEDDPLFSRKGKANGKAKQAAQPEVIDDFEVVEEEKAAPTTLVAGNGKKKDVKLEHLTDEQVEKGSAISPPTLARPVRGTLSSHSVRFFCVELSSAAAYQRILSFLHASGIARGEGLMTKSLSPLSQYLARLPYGQLGEAEARLHRWSVCRRQSRLRTHWRYDSQHTQLAYVSIALVSAI